MNSRILLLLGVAPLFLSGCADLPRSGPTTSAIVHAGNMKAPDYALIDLTTGTAVAANRAFKSDYVRKAEIRLEALPRPAPIDVVARGDVLTVTMWEPNPSGTTLLGQGGLSVKSDVDDSGDIVVPYVGTIRAIGMSPNRLSEIIQGRLSAEGHDIQVSVFDDTDLGSGVIVQGSVARPGRLKLSPESRTVLDVISLAGGASIPDYAGEVRITRRGIPVEVSLSSLVNDGALDVRVSPGDQIMVMPQNRYYYALGAVNAPGERPYDAGSISLTRALATIGGLNDNLAAPRGVFVFRREPADITRRIDPGVTGSTTGQVVFRLNMATPDALFAADLFRVRPDDVIYVSDAPVADLTKVLQTISGVSNIGAIPRNFGAGY